MAISAGKTAISPARWTFWVPSALMLTTFSAKVRETSLIIFWGNLTSKKKPLIQGLLKTDPDDEASIHPYAGERASKPSSLPMANPRVANQDDHAWMSQAVSTTL